MKNAFALTLAGLTLAAPALAASNSQSGVDAIALYARGAAVVQDSRTVKLDKGDQTIAWPVSGALDPATFAISGDGVRLTGFDATPNQGSSSTSPLAARVGRSVRLQTPNGKSKHGTLVAVDNDTVYVRINDRIERITGASPTQISWPAAETASNGKGAGDRVRMHISADQAGQRKLTATYQTGAPSWQASYTGRFNPSSGKLALAANAVIDNSGHGALDADRAWLVAGDTARADSGRPRPMMMARAASGEAAKTGQPQAVGDVYRYPLAGGLHVAAGSVQSVALIQPIQVDAKRHYRFENYALNDSGDARRHVDASLSFDNTSGEPLPGGAVRIYDAGHAAQLMGGTRIDDTPAGAPVSLSLGGAFNVTGTHRVTKRAATDNGRRTTQVSVELFNAGDQKKQVTVAERLPGNAELADDAPQTSGGSADQPEWRVTVPAGGHKSLTYSFSQPQSS